MATWGKGIARLTCPECDAVWAVEYQDEPERSKGTVDCDQCGGVILRYNGSRDYYGATLVTPGDPAKISERRATRAG